MASGLDHRPRNPVENPGNAGELFCLKRNCSYHEVLTIHSVTDSSGFFEIANPVRLGVGGVLQHSLLLSQVIVVAPKYSTRSRTGGFMDVFHFRDSLPPLPHFG
jgi:hypothetical protein